MATATACTTCGCRPPVLRPLSRLLGCGDRGPRDAELVLTPSGAAMYAEFCGCCMPGSLHSTSPKTQLPRAGQQGSSARMKAR